MNIFSVGYYQVGFDVPSYSFLNYVVGYRFHRGIVRCVFVTVNGRKSRDSNYRIKTRR